MPLADRSDTTATRSPTTSPKKVSFRHPPISTLDMASEELVPIEQFILPEVGLTLKTDWQSMGTGAASFDEVRGAQPFQITGPKLVMQFLKECQARDAAAGLKTSYSGYLSPPNQITIQGDRARKAGIPMNAVSYAYCYPVDAVAAQYQRLICEEARTDPWLSFLMLGGYAYFDSKRELICTNSFVLTPTDRMFTLTGPFEPSEKAVAALRDASRLRKISLAPYVDAGFSHFAWINPNEKPGGFSMLADGLEVDNNGYFLYEMSSGRFDLYPLVRKESLASSAQSIGLLELSEHSEKDGKDDDSVKRVKSARTSKWRITSAAFQEKQSLERAKTLMYRPSTFGVAAEEDLKGGPVKIDPKNYVNMQVYKPTGMGATDAASARSLLSGAVSGMKAQASRNSDMVSRRSSDRSSAPPSPIPFNPEGNGGGSSSSTSHGVPQQQPQPETPARHVPTPSPYLPPPKPPSVASPIFQVPNTAPIFQVPQPEQEVAPAPASPRESGVASFLGQVMTGLRTPRRPESNRGPGVEDLDAFRADIRDIRAEIHSLKSDQSTMRPQIKRECAAAWEPEVTKLRELVQRLQIDLRESKVENKTLRKSVEKLEEDTKGLRERVRKGEGAFGCCGGASDVEEPSSPANRENQHI